MAAAPKELGPSPTSVLGMAFEAQSVEDDCLLLASVGEEHLPAPAGHSLAQD